MMKTIRTLAITIAAAFLATMSVQAAQKKWTVMVLIAGDNNLEYYLTTDIETELALAGASSDSNLGIDVCWWWSRISS